MLPLAGFDVIFMRANPPLDNIVLNFLDSVKNDVFIVNNVEGLREANNKVYTAAFNDPNNEIVPKTYVSKNKNYLKEIIQESDAERMIMKPLNGFGGSGVIVLEKGATHNISSLLISSKASRARATTSSCRSTYRAPKKATCVCSCCTVSPLVPCAVYRLQGMRAPMYQPGAMWKSTPSPKPNASCAKPWAKARARRLYFVGLDLIGGKLIEVNVLSPGGISYINKPHKTRLQTKVIDYVEDVVGTAKPPPTAAWNSARL